MPKLIRQLLDRAASQRRAAIPLLGWVAANHDWPAEPARVSTAEVQAALDSLDCTAGTQQPAADGLPEGALASAEAGAAMLDGPCNEYGRNVLAHALVQLQCDGWLRQKPAAFMPARGDHVEAWLKAQRDEYEQQTSEQWRALDEVLDTYRLHADTGTPLDQHCCEGGNVDDCRGCHDEADRDELYQQHREATRA